MLLIFSSQISQLLACEKLSMCVGAICVENSLQTLVVPVLAVQTFPLQLELMNEQVVACHLSKGEMVLDSAQNSLSMPVSTLKDVNPWNECILQTEEVQITFANLHGT